MRARFPAVLALALLLPGCGGGGDDPLLPEETGPEIPSTPALPGTWARRAPLPFPRSEMHAAVLDGKVYVVGGLVGMEEAVNRVDVYDPAADRWSSAPPLPEGRHHYGIAVANGKLYVIGGYGSGPFPWEPRAQVFEFDPAAQRWRTRAPLPAARAALAAVAVDGKIYAIGGERGHGHAGTVVEEYDPATDAWRPRANLPTAREHLAAVAIGSTIYAVGGRETTDHVRYWETTTNQAALEAFSPATNAWTRLKPMPTARGGLAAAALDGKLYAMGGEHPAVFPANEEYDPATDSWRKMAGLPTPRHGLAAAVVGNTIHVIGGGEIKGASGTDAHEAFTVR